jgi:hypothetical protein
MRNLDSKKLRVIKIMDPVLCMACNQAYVADVTMSDGHCKKMFYCSRLDCDNWMIGDTKFQEISIDKLPKL